MHRKTTRLAAALAFLTLVVPVGSGFAAEKESRGAEAREQRQERRGQAREALFRDIELTDDPREEIGEIMAAHREEVEAWREANADKIEALRTAMRDAREDRDREAGQRVREDMRALRETMPSREDVHEKITAVLTDDQAAQFEDNLAELREKAEKRRGERPRGERPRRERPTPDA